MALLFGGILAVPAQALSPAGSSNGTIEICKSSKNGMSGQAFQFTLNGGAPITVLGGGCSGPLSTASGHNTVVEAPHAGTEVASIKSNQLVSSDLASGTAVVNVKADSTPRNETLVTYTNRPPRAVGLKVCKVAGSPDLVGDGFSFTENGGPAYTVHAGTPAAPNCGSVHAYPLGTLVNVAELDVPNAQTEVSAITVSDNRGSNFNTAAGTVTATIGAGVTVVTYTNIVKPPEQFGFIEVCKYASDSYVSGNFDFTITDSNASVRHETVAVGQCTAPLKVRAGNVQVAEAGRFPYYVSSIVVNPSNRLVTSNLANQTATVTVPKGDESTETVVSFYNATRVGLVKICKTLAPNGVDLAGKTFYFWVTDVNGSHQVSVIAGSAGSTTCVFDSSQLPLGSHVSITEQSVPNVQVVSVTVAPASQDDGSAPPTANLTVGSGVTTATFTNQAYGTVEVCKHAADKSTADEIFQFSVNGGAPIAVQAGHCSQPISVPAGTATVAELAKTNFRLVKVDVSGHRHVSGTNPVTVSVPYGGVENETVVTFTNAVEKGQFKICKVSSEPSLQNVTFHFTYSYTKYGKAIHGATSLKPGACSGFSKNIPVVNENGQPIAITVIETIEPETAVASIDVANGTKTSENLATGTVVFSVNKGVSAVTYTNVRDTVHNGE